MTLTAEIPVTTSGKAVRRSTRPTAAPTPACFVLDTSVVMTDPVAHLAYEGTQVVIPLTVIDELDNNKSRSDVAGRNARHFLNQIEALRREQNGKLSDAFALPGGGTLRIEPNGLRLDELVDLHLDPAVPDHRIIAAALGLAHDGAKVTVVSNDTALRVKATVAGLHAIEHTPGRVGTHAPNRRGYHEVSFTPEGIKALASLPRTGVDLLDLPAADQAALDELDLFENEYLWATGTALTARYCNGKIVPLNKTYRPWGATARNKEQAFALDLLSDQRVPLIALRGHAGTGKMEPLTNRLPVPVSDRFPTGWATIGDLQVGDMVFAADGTAVAVLGLSEVRREAAYTLRLRDGQTIKCGPDHLWKVSSELSRNAHVPFQRNRREARAEAANSEAARLVALASEFGAGKLVALSELSRLTGRSDSNLRLVLPKNIATEASEGSRTLLYPLDESLVLLAAHVRELGGRSDSGRAARDLETIMSTKDMAQSQHTRGTRANWAIRLAAPIDGPDASLPLDPYVLGCWLGDGGKHHGCITTMDEQIAQAPVEAGFPILRAQRGSSGAASTYFYKGLVPALREAGFTIFPTRGITADKHIPAGYLRASAAQRLALLQGIMDTDGSIDSRGICELTLCHDRLASDCLELVRSLGIRAAKHTSVAQITESDPENPGKTRRRATGLRHRIVFTTSTPVFRLERKAARIPGDVRATQQWLYIDDIEAGEPEEMRCIYIDHPEHLYLTADFVPTHNTLLAIAAGLEAVINQGRYNQLVILRPLVSVGRQDLGFLPGDVAEKIGPWFDAVIDVLIALSGTDDHGRKQKRLTYAEAKALLDGFIADGTVVLAPVTFLRGRTFHSTFMILDEAQNMPPEVVKTVISRLGESSRLVLNGDDGQLDVPYMSALTCGLNVAVDAFAGESLFGQVHFPKGERSRLADLAAERM